MHVRQGLADKMVAMSSPPRRTRPLTVFPEQLWVENLSSHVTKIAHQTIGSGLTVDFGNNMTTYYPEQFNDVSFAFLQANQGTSIPTYQTAELSCMSVHSEDARLGIIKYGMIGKDLYDVITYSARETR